jgi:hypothetical protein
MASLKKAYAAAHGCDERTARRHFNSNSESWQKFIAKTGMAAAEKVKPGGEPPADSEAAALQVLSPASPSDVKPPPEASRPDSELSQPEKIVKQQWAIYAQASKAWLQAMKEQDSIGALNFGLAANKALDTYYRALARLEAWQLSSRRLIPWDEFQALQPIMESLFEMLRSFPAEIALEANPQNPSLARRVAEDWLAHRFNPQAQSFLAKIEDTTSVQHTLNAA